MVKIGTLAIVCESAKKKKMSKEDYVTKRDYEQFKAHNNKFAKNFGLDKYDLADSKGLTGKGGALAGAAAGALYGAPFGPHGMAIGALSGALGGAGGTKLGRYITHRTYGEFDKKNDPSW